MTVMDDWAIALHSDHMDPPPTINHKKKCSVSPHLGGIPGKADTSFDPRDIGWGISPVEFY